MSKEGPATFSMMTSTPKNTPTPPEKLNLAFGLMKLNSSFTFSPSAMPLQPPSYFTPALNLVAMSYCTPT